MHPGTDASPTPATDSPPAHASSPTPASANASSPALAPASSPTPAPSLASSPAPASPALAPSPAHASSPTPASSRGLVWLALFILAAGYAGLRLEMNHEFEGAAWDELLAFTAAKPFGLRVLVPLLAWPLHSLLRM